MILFSGRAKNEKKQKPDNLNNLPYLIHSQVIQHWVDTWTANTTQDEFKEVLDALCKKLDRPNRVAIQ